MNALAQMPRRLSIRTWLTLGSLSLVVGLAGAMLAVVAIQQQAASQRLSQTHLAADSRRIVSRVNQLLRAAEMTAESASHTLPAEVSSTGNWREVFARLVPAFEQHPELTYLGFALAQTGEAAFLHRKTDGGIEWLLCADKPGAGRQISTFLYRAGSFMLQSVAPWDGYDPRLRPYFTQAAGVRRPGWTPAYPFTDPEGRHPLLGVTFFIPVFATGGELEGVWNSDLDTRALSEFLAQIDSEIGVGAFLVEERPGGRQILLAHPDPSRLARATETPKRTDRQWLAEQGPSTLADASRPWNGIATELGGGRPAWEVFTIASESLEEEAFRIRQHWLLVFVAAGAAVAAIGGSAALARFGSRPVEELTEAVRRTENGERACLPHRPAPRQLVELAATFRRMAETIAVRQGELAHTNESLRKEISRRAKQEALLGAVISNVPFELVVWDALGRCILQNAASRSGLGDRMGANALDPVQGGRPGFSEGFKQALKGPVLHRNLMQPQGDKIAFSHVVYAPVKAEGRTIGVVCVSFDVTEQRRAEEALRSSQRRLSVHLENTPLGVIDWTPDFHVAAWNQAAELIFGWSAGEAIGKSAGFLIPEAEREGVQNSWAKLLQSGGSTRYSNPNLTRDGRTIECEWYSTVVTDADGKIAGVSSLVLDVTERAGIERMFRESEERFQKAFRRSASPLSIVRLIDGAILDVNERWERAFGFSRRKAIGTTAVALGVWSDPDTRSEFNRELDKVGELQDWEVPLNRADGSRGIFLISANLVNLGSEAAVMVSSVDITDRKRAEDEVRNLNEGLEARVAERTRDLEQANAKLKELDRLKSEFLATMSHELRTPLNSIVGFSSILGQGMAGPLNEEQARQIEIVNQSARHLLTLINDLLDVSRIEAGRVELFMETVDAGKVLDQVQTTLAPMVTSKSLIYETIKAPGLPSIRTDRKRLYQVVLNLANNAVKFTEKGSVRVQAQADGAGLVIRVIDTGIGIRAENLPRLFEAFRQVDGSARRVYEGTGLGLYLVRKLMHLLGGRVEAESRFGEGSIFTLHFPPSPPETPSAASVWEPRISRP